MRKSMWIILGITCAFNIALWSCSIARKTGAGWSGTFNYVSSALSRRSGSHRKSVSGTGRNHGGLAFRSRTRPGDSNLLVSGRDGSHPRDGHASWTRGTAGAWIDGRYERNEDEIYNLIPKNVNRYPANIKRVIVGNEALYRTDLSVGIIISYLRHGVREAVKVPVGSGRTPGCFSLKTRTVRHRRLSSHQVFALLGDGSLSHR